MRWKGSGIIDQLSENCRVRRVFLWKPVSILGEVRWLEWAEIRERQTREYYDVFIPNWGSDECYRDVWSAVGWGWPERMVP